MTRLLASELYAISQSTICQGKEQCHWCTAHCGPNWIHDDVYPIPYCKTKSSAKLPNNRFICIGCWLFRRKRVTVNFLNGEYKDGQKISNYSWFIFKSGCVAIRKQDAEEMYEELLDPPLLFSLSLIEEGFENIIQLSVVNEFEEIKANTPIGFTLNNIPHSYTVYELKEALKNEESEGKEPGVSALIRYFGYMKFEEKKEKRKRGRPLKSETIGVEATTALIKK